MATIHSSYKSQGIDCKPQKTIVIMHRANQAFFSGTVKISIYPVVRSFESVAAGKFTANPNAFSLV
jgi:hypothetical protein